MEALGVPIWFFAICAVCSLLVGVGIRRWLDHRKAREEAEIKERAKELKKQQKRYKKQARKAEKKKKNNPDA